MMRRGCHHVMALREDLASGILGLRWAPPPSLEWMENEERVAAARDPERQVAWLIRSYPWRLDLRRAFDAELRADLKLETRAIFAANAEEDAAAGGQPAQTPARTADPGWSPIVDLERVLVGEAGALRVVWRMVRAALRWLLDIEAVGEVLLEPQGCAVVPRHLLVPQEVLPRGPTLVSFALASLGDAPVRLLDVGRLPDEI
jgi:hypothetical protein